MTSKKKKAPTDDSVENPKEFLTGQSTLEVDPTITAKNLAALDSSLSGLVQSALSATEQMVLEPPSGVKPGMTQSTSGESGSITTHEPLSPTQILQERGLNPNEWQVVGLNATTPSGEETEGYPTWTRYSLKYIGPKQEVSLLTFPNPKTKINVRIPRTRKGTSGGRREVLVIPDIQFDYARSSDGQLYAGHDESAINVLHQIGADLKPDEIVNLGDLIDNEPLSKYNPKDPQRVLTLQQAFDRAHLELCIYRELLAESSLKENGDPVENSLVLMLGNHDETRLVNTIQQYAPALLGLRQAGTSNPPLLSYSHILGLDALGVKAYDYRTSHWLDTGTLRFIHGVKVNSSGSTASTLANGGGSASTIFGHVHRREYVSRTVELAHGEAQNVFFATPGTLAKLTADIPGYHSALSPTGRQIPVRENWQHGGAVVSYIPGEPYSETFEMIEINNGVAYFRGNEYRVNVNDLIDITDCVQGGATE